MAVPIRLKSMPEHIRAQYGFPYPHIEPSSQRQQSIDSGQEACEDLQMLQFPKTKVILWDHTVTGPPVFLHFAQYRKPRICLSEKVLRIAHRQCVSCGRPMECVLIGSLNVDDDGEGLVFSIDRLDNRPSSASTLRNLAPGDVMIPVKMNLNESSASGSSVEDYATAVKLLRQRCESKDTVDVTNFLLTKGTCNFYSRVDQSIAHLDFDVVTLSTVIKASPISPVPIVPTALSKNLAGPKSISHIQGTPKSGYLTMDHTRKLLLVLESDPKVLNLPVVGIWVSGVSMVHHPFVWASCIRYMHNKLLQDRVCNPPEAFLVVLYSTLHSRPEFYECNTTTGRSNINFDLFEGYEATNLNTSVVSLQNGLLDCELASVPPGKKREMFDAALSHSKQEVPETGGRIKMPENGTVTEDMVPRCTPAPHQARLSAAQPMVPEVSLYFPDSSQNLPENHSAPNARQVSQVPGPQNSQPRKPLPKQTLARHMTFSPPVTPHYNNEDSYGSIQSTGNTSYPEILHQGQKRVPVIEDESKSLPSKVYSPQGYEAVDGNHRVQGWAAQSQTHFNLKGQQHGHFIPSVSNKHEHCHPNGCNCHGCRQQGIGNAQANQQVHNGQLQQDKLLNVKPNFTSKNQTCHGHENSVQLQNQGFPSTLSHSALPPNDVQHLQPKYSQNVQNANVLPVFNGQPGPDPKQNMAAHRSHIPRPTTNYKQAGPTNTAPPTSAIIPTQHQLNSAFTPNPHLLSGQGLPQHPAPQQLAGCHQENLPGFLPQLQTSYNSSQIHTESTCSGKSSDDSGLSVTPDRLNPSPKTGSPNTPDKTSSSLPAAASLDTINWEQVPPEIFQLIMAQNAQLQQLQAQMQQLLLQQSLNQATPTPQTNRAAESGIGISPSTREMCETAVNTTLVYPSPEKTTPSRNVNSVSLQTSPVKTASVQSSPNGRDIAVDSRTNIMSDSVPSSSTQTPVEIRHKGALPLNSTHRDEHDSNDMTQGDFNAVVDNIALHNQTVDSVQSELILDMPSYQSSPTSRSQKDSASLDGSYQTSPISASMCGNSKTSASQEDEEEQEESGPVDEAYYEHLLGNIRHLLNSHSSIGSRDQSETVTEHLQMKLPPGSPGGINSLSSSNTSSHQDHTHLSNLMMRNGADTTFIPRINYLSMMMESDTDTSMEINAMALKYLTDDQLTQLGKLRKNSLNLPKNASKTALLRKVLMNDTTISPDVSQYGMSSNNITMGTQKYLEKYGLLNSTNGTALTDETVTDETLQLKVDYSIAETPVRSRVGKYCDVSSPCHTRKNKSAETSPWDQSERFGNHSGHSSTSSGARSPIKKDFVAFSHPQGWNGKACSTSPIKHTSPPQTVDQGNEQESSQMYGRRHYDDFNQARFPSAKTSSDFQVFNTSDVPDNILDIDKLRQMPKLL